MKSTDITPDLLECGKRMSDVLNLHLNFHDRDELLHKWVAFKLQDGSSDGVLYDSKRDAVRHQFSEFHCAYISFRNLGGGTNPKDCAIFLQFTRDAYDAGMRLPDPDDASGGPDAIVTTGQRDWIKHRINLRALQGGFRGH
jgi:hypothetical protein